MLPAAPSTGNYEFDDNANNAGNDGIRVHAKIMTEDSSSSSPTAWTWVDVQGARKAPIYFWG